MSTLTGRVRDSGLAVRDRGVTYLDTYLPPSQRQEYSESVRRWAAVNPKLAAFVFAQLLLSGPPILLFLTFGFTVLTTSLLVCLLTALTVAFAFTSLLTGLALLILLPTLFVSSIAATLLFVCGFIGNAAVSKFNNDPRTAGIRSRAKSNVAAMGNSVKDASNGSIDLNSAAQHFANKASESMPSTKDESSEKRAQEYLARQAMGIPGRHGVYESEVNGAGSRPQSNGLEAAVNLTSNQYVQSTTESAAVMDDQVPPGTANGFVSNTGKLQVVN